MRALILYWPERGSTRSTPGHGGFGQNGNGTTEDLTRPRPVPIPADAAVTGIHTGRYHSLAIIDRP